MNKPQPAAVMPPQPPHPRPFSAAAHRPWRPVRHRRRSTAHAEATDLAPPVSARLHRWGVAAVAVLCLLAVLAAFAVIAMDLDDLVSADTPVVAPRGWPLAQAQAALAPLPPGLAEAAAAWLAPPTPAQAQTALDQALAQRVQATLASDADTGRFYLTVASVQGEVHLGGRVARAADVARALALARGTLGVRSVQHGLMVQP